MEVASLGKEPMGFVLGHELLLTVTSTLVKLQLLFPFAEQGARRVFSLSPSAAATAISLPVKVTRKTGQDRTRQLGTRVIEQTIAS